MPIDEVVSRMRAGEFKPNCALGASCFLRPKPVMVYLLYISIQVLLDFLVRHGYLTPENEPRYLEITQRLHGRFDIERW
jgi:hypothetical protein